MTGVLRKHIPDAFRRVAKTVGYALMLGDAEAWHGLTAVLKARLTPVQRAAMAWAVLRSLPADQARAVALTVLPSRQPIAPLFNHADEAATWAAMAEQEELDAYALACFRRMSAAKQAMFADFVAGKVPA